MFGMEIQEGLFVFLGVFVLSALLLHFAIPVLVRHKVGQSIYELGPRWHAGKQNTPTMGGMFFLFAFLVVMLIAQAVRGIAFSLPGQLAIGLGVANGAVGFLDDRTKLSHRRNMGLTAGQKLFLQLLIAVIYIGILRACGYLDGSLLLPGLFLRFNLDWLYPPFAILFILAMVNSSNLTDGLDGLAAGVGMPEFLFIAFLGFCLHSREMLLIGIGMAGACGGFLLYNHHPARVFMGDTGSLFLGGVLAGLAFLTNCPLIIAVISGVYLLEMLSSFLQIFWFKITHGKRLFRMAPFHHHLECRGWKETAIVSVFCLTEILFCALAWFLCLK